jgi:hypothetical protein
MESYNSSITQTAESITLAVSKTVQGQNKTYAQKTKPDYVEVDDSVVKAFTTISDCIGYYYKTETEDTDGNVTTTWTKIEADVKLSLSEIKKKTLYSTPIKNDVWIYTDSDLYVMSDDSVAKNIHKDAYFDYTTATKTSEYVGHYICTDTPEEKLCPHCSGADYLGKQCYIGKFTLVTAKNKDSVGIDPGKTTAYNLHLASNTTFYWDGSN